MLAVGSLAYVAWTAGRVVGTALAIIAWSLQVLQTDHEPSGRLVFYAGLWLMLYLLVVVITSAIEVATRPE